MASSGVSWPATCAWDRAVSNGIGETTWVECEGYGRAGGSYTERCASGNPSYGPGAACRDPVTPPRRLDRRPGREDVGLRSQNRGRACVLGKTCSYSVHKQRG